MGFWQFWKIFSEFGKQGNRFRCFVLFGKDHTFQEPHLGVKWTLNQESLRFAQRLVILSATQQRRYLRSFIGMHRSNEQQGKQAR